MPVAKSSSGDVESGAGTPTPSLGVQQDIRTPASTVQLLSKIPRILPHERVFPIQIGSELFKLSGASISSDGMSRSGLPPSLAPPPCAVRNIGV